MIIGQRHMDGDEPQQRGQPMASRIPQRVRNDEALLVWDEMTQFDLVGVSDFEFRHQVLVVRAPQGRQTTEGSTLSSSETFAAHNLEAQHGQTALHTPTSSPISVCPVPLSQPSAPWVGLYSSSLVCICLHSPVVFFILSGLILQFLLYSFNLAPAIYLRLPPLADRQQRASVTLMGPRVSGIPSPSQQQTKIQTDRIAPLHCGRYQTLLTFVSQQTTLFRPSSCRRCTRKGVDHGHLHCGPLSAVAQQCMHAPSRPPTLGSWSHPSHLLREHSVRDTHLPQHSPASTSHRRRFRLLLEILRSRH